MKQPKPLDRRTALTTIGTVGLGTIIAACSGSSTDSSSTSSTSSTSTTPSSSSSGGGSAAVELFQDAASCTVSPEQTEGPFYIDVDSIRSDIRDERDGVELRLATRVLDASSCSPIANTIVDIWHCDATGVYSGFDDGEGATFLRGAQVTNGDGIAEFFTIYPGWYQGRTVHVHAKVHLDNSTLLTTQLYFPEDVNDAVFNHTPYRSAGRDTTNVEDGIFDDLMVMSLHEDGDGYLAIMNVNVER